VQGESVSADDQEANVMVDERAQQIDKALIHRRIRLAIATGPRSGAR
jgi:hypothetical protein